MASRPTHRACAASRRLKLQQLERRLMLAGDTLGLLRDINTTIPSTRPTEFVESGGKVFISAEDGIHGHELLVSDGVNPPRLVKDIQPGPFGSAPSHLTDVDGVLYFVADDGLVGRELWKSDGTESGTVRVADIYPGEMGSAPISLTVATIEDNAKLFFVADSPDNGLELWSADDSGASMVVDLWFGDDEFGNPNSSFPQYLTFWPQHLDDAMTLVPPTLFFSAETGTTGRELWQTVIEGESTTTTQVKNIFDDAAGQDPNSSNPTDLVLFENQIYFAAEGAEFDAEMNLIGDGIELWRSDGTEDGTELVSDIFPGFAIPAEMENPFNSSPSSLTVHNGLLYFSANSPSLGRELWSFDGEANSAPTLVRNIRGGSGSSSPTDFTSTDGFLFFTADGGQGRELWRTDGTTAGTQITRDIRPGFATPFLFTRGFAKLGSSVIFGADDGTLGPEVWISDGTFDGTQLLKEIQFGRNSSNVPSAYTTIGDQVYFEASQQIWRTDGTTSGSERLAPETKATLGSIEESFGEVGPQIFARANGLVFFPADDGENGVELWKSDGTTFGTTLVTDLAPGTSITFPGSTIETPNSSNPEELTTVGDQVFFRTEPGSQLHVTDGSESGTFPIGSATASQLTPFLGKLFFAGRTPDSGSELWMSDGTSAGTMIVRDLASGASSSYPDQLTVVGDKLFFVADGGNGQELWVSDGTTEGTMEINIAADFGSYPALLTPAGNRVFFRADDGVNGPELWVSDGTAEGTMLVRDIHDVENDYYGSNPIPLAEINGTLLFFADDRVSGQKLWKTDGTVDGTVVVTDIWPTSEEDEFFPDESTGPARLVAVLNDKVFFPANDGSSGTELWSSDGTPGGTAMVADLMPGEDASFPTELVVVADQLAFVANQGDPFFPGEFFGRELWFSDGTDGGTQVASEINLVDFDGSDPRSLAVLGGSLYFVANDGVHGDEVWTTKKRLKADDPLFEILARDIAYRDSLTAGGSAIAVGTEINLEAIGYPSPFIFQVDMVIHDATTGFDAYGLVADDSDPILLIRGSAGIDDFFSDAMPAGVGVNQFEANQTELFQWIDDHSAPNHNVSITGHSLGGALTQLVAAAYTAAGGELAQVVTFNAPGISSDRAAAFIPANAERVMHYITNGDPVSLAGDAFIDGRWRRSNFDDLLILHNHQYPVLVDFTIADDPATIEVEKRRLSESLSFTDYEDTSWLNSPLYFHTDTDYFFWLAVIQGIVSTTPELADLRTLPGQLLFRSTTEAARQSVGHFIDEHREEIDEAIAVVTCDATDTTVSAADIHVTLLGLLEVQATDLSARCVPGPPKELRLQGKVVLPQLNNATADFAGEGNYIGLGETGLVKEGRLSIDELPLLPGFWSLHDVFVDIRDTTNTIEAGGTLELPTGISVAATLGFLNNQFNKISLEVPGPLDPDPLNQPLGSTGIFLQRIRGEVDHVASSDENPISFGGGLEATGGPTVSISLPSWAGGTLSGKLIDFAVDGSLDKNHIVASGTLNVIEGVAEVTGDVEVNWNEGFLESGGALNVLDGLITANGTFRADSSLDINAFADATFGIPDDIPLIGGYDAVTGKFTLDYSNDSTNANDFVAAWTTFDLVYFGETHLGFRVFLDGRFGTIGAEEIAELTPPGPPGEGEHVGGSAMYQIKPDTTWALLSAQWDSGATDRTIVLTMPSGETITEANLAGRTDIAIVNDLSGPMRRVVIIDQPDAGQWTVSVNDDTSLTGLRFNAFIENAVPTVNVQANDGLRGAAVEIAINATDPDSDATVSLFYDTDNQGFDGIRIVGGLPENVTAYSWNPSALLSGEYFIYAVIDDGINPVQFAYAEQSIQVTPGPQHATVYLPVNGGVFEAFVDNTDFVVRQQAGQELFRSPQADLLSVEILGVANIDDSLLTDLDGLLIPLSLDGGHNGRNVFSLTGLGQTVDLAHSVDLSLSHVDLLDITGSGDNSLTISADDVMELAPETSTVQLRHDKGDQVAYDGSGWQVEQPIFIDGQQWHVLTNASARLEASNDLPFQNPLERTDVNFSGDSTPLDALLIINLLARSNSDSVAFAAPTSYAELPERYYDVNGSNSASPIDALLIINELARRQSLQGLVEAEMVEHQQLTSPATASTLPNPGSGFGSSPSDQDWEEMLLLLAIDQNASRLF